METATSKDFIGMCHILYDRIHGKSKVIKIFHPINESQIKDLIIIYKTSDLFLRWYNINQYIAKLSNLKYNKNNAKAFPTLTDFYVNAIQHYVCKDY